MAREAIRTNRLSPVKRPQWKVSLRKRQAAEDQTLCDGVCFYVSRGGADLECRLFSSYAAACFHYVEPLSLRTELYAVRR